MACGSNGLRWGLSVLEKHWCAAGIAREGRKRRAGFSRRMHASFTGGSLWTPRRPPLTFPPSPSLAGLSFRFASGAGWTRWRPRRRPRPRSRRSTRSGRCRSTSGRRPRAPNGWRRRKQGRGDGLGGEGSLSRPFAEVSLGEGMVHPAFEALFSPLFFTTPLLFHLWLPRCSAPRCVLRFISPSSPPSVTPPRPLPANLPAPLAA